MTTKKCSQIKICIHCTQKVFKIYSKHQILITKEPKKIMWLASQKITRALKKTHTQYNYRRKCKILDMG